MKIATLYTPRTHLRLLGVFDEDHTDQISIAAKQSMFDYDHIKKIWWEHDDITSGAHIYEAINYKNDRVVYVLEVKEIDINQLYGSSPMVLKY